MGKIDLRISRNEFFRDYFERNFYIQEMALAADLLTRTDIESLLYGADPCDGTVRIFLNGVIPITEYARPYNDIDGPKYRFMAERIQRLFAEGATIVMNRVDNKISSVGTICDEIAEFVGERAVANAYICSGGVGTFGKHWDTHDVFAIQLHGRKRWRIYGSTHILPLAHQTSRDHKAQCPIVPLFDADIRAGDLIYIPRGWWHEATPLENQISTHIAIGVHTTKYIDYLIWFCETVGPTLVESRASMQDEENSALLTAALLPKITTLLQKKEYVREFLEQRFVQPMPRNFLVGSE
ncbi:hypothetical protein CAL12_20615 [Bordetella genomosp. 8]|uniref:JmjC domain-containing protein n=1 Tax=Bordetella genomosp. 8 TaxID=1416806 RepID=A0A1W6YPP2_9BORD|nr:cupin domain-containing protein [Bordetella genomosp. 8]ARP82981.1 hypothetical protein CAL12_20615 [Bordetella genomosp. 8]